MYITAFNPRTTKIIIVVLTSAMILLASIVHIAEGKNEDVSANTQADDKLKWVEFNVPYDVLARAMEYDIDSHNIQDDENENSLTYDMCSILACLAARNWGNISNCKASDVDNIIKKLSSGETIEALTEKYNQYDYFYTAYTSILGGFLGEYSICAKDSDESQWKTEYGLKAYFPLAEGFYYEHYDDFGNSRSYGYQRRHLGHDLLASLGTPVISVESGIVEELGWNQYGGWRIGIRSLDKKRYYYYAHLRKDHPYAPTIEKGMTVAAGDVIGYVGKTGYSTTENVDGMTKNHLHFGMQLIFDEAEKDGTNQIWIDLYAITKLLSQHKSTVTRTEDEKDFVRAYNYSEPELEKTVSAYASNAEAELPILMYHNVYDKADGKNDYIISTKEFEDDLKYLKENNYSTVVMQDVIDFVKEGKPLPDNPVMLTFDDGQYNNIYFAEPLLEKYSMKGVLSIVGKFTDDAEKNGADAPEYSYLTWQEVKDTISRETFEIQNHTYNLHSLKNNQKGTKRKVGETDEQYRERLSSDVNKLQQLIEAHTGYLPNTFTYPYGIISDGSTEILKNCGFEASLTCSEGTNKLVSGDTKTLFLLKRNIRDHKNTAKSILTKYKNGG